MLSLPPQEREWLSWLAVALWTAFIFASIPFARTIRNVVSDRWSREVFLYMTLLAVALAAGLTLIALSRSSKKLLSSYLWTVGVGTVFVGYTIHLRDSPEEALHFVQYGVLSYLAFRALSHRIRDPSIYLAAVTIGLIVGVLDEAIQWVTPRRFWGLRDIWIDLLGAALVQVGIALGLRPSFISGSRQPESTRWLCRLGIALVVVLTLTALNTPARIDWYSSRWSSLAFLRTNESVMFEYGYRYTDPDTGPFRSRFAPDQLSRLDALRGREVARILDSYRDDAEYGHFLKTYTPVSDPFVHEARVHLFRRDRNLEYADAEGLTEHEIRSFLTVAHRETRIMEKYFPNTYQHSGFVLSPELRQNLAENLVSEAELPPREVESGVSKHLITTISEPQILTVSLAAIAALIAIDLRVGRVGATSDD